MQQCLFLCALVVVVQVLGKAEFLNPGGSVKDRVALCIVQEALVRLQHLPHPASSTSKSQLDMQLMPACGQLCILSHLCLLALPAGLL